MLDQNNDNDIHEIEFSDKKRLSELSKRRLSAKNKRRQQLKTRLLLLGGTAAAIIILITAVSLISAGSNKKSPPETQTSAISEVKAENVKAANKSSSSAASYNIAKAELALSPEPTPEPTPEPLLTDDGSGTTVRICMVGDVLLSSAINATCDIGNGCYDYNVMFQNTASLIQSYDLKIVNEETACGGTEYGISGYPSFNSPHEAQDAMANAGFNCVCLASNHMLDFGPNPLFSTLDYWHSCYPNIATIGAYRTEEDSNQIYVYQKDDFRIAVLNYTYGSNAGSGAYYDVPWALNILEEEAVYADIQLAKSLADYIIVCPHWGTEYNLGIDDYQNYWASLFLEWGVNLVIGTHPHVIEPIEYRTDDQGHSMLIYYSIGNFISNQDNAFSLLGAMADITLRKNETGIYIDDFGAVPLATHKSYYYSTYPLNYYSQELAAASNGPAIDPEFSYDYCVNLANSIYGDRIRYY